MTIRTLRAQFKSIQTRVPRVEGRGNEVPLLDARRSALGGRMAYEAVSDRGRAGFTLIEIMVVVVILGVLAATLIPQFIGTTHDARVSAAKAHVAELEGALERFYVHMDRYPTMDEGLKALVEPPTGEDKKWRGPYIRELRRDPWGNPYQYRIPGVRHPASFDLWSRGADGADGGEGQGADIGNWAD